MNNNLKKSILTGGLIAAMMLGTGCATKNNLKPVSQTHQVEKKSSFDNLKQAEPSVVPTNIYEVVNPATCSFDSYQRVVDKTNGVHFVDLNKTRTHKQFIEDKLKLYSNEDANASYISGILNEVATNADFNINALNFLETRGNCNSENMADRNESIEYARSLGILMNAAKAANYTFGSNFNFVERSAMNNNAKNAFNDYMSVLFTEKGMGINTKNAFTLLSAVSSGMPLSILPTGIQLLSNLYNPISTEGTGIDYSKTTIYEINELTIDFSNNSKLPTGYMATQFSKLLDKNPAKVNRVKENAIQYNNYIGGNKK